MVELSIIIPTLLSPADIPCAQALSRQEFTDYEVVVRGDKGASRARNEAIARAQADKLVFLDDDSIPRPGYLAAVSAALDRHSVVAGRVFQPADAPITHKRLPWYDQGDVEKPTDLVVGCNMAMRREVIEAVGGFNEIFYHGHEETELGRRISEQFQIYYVPELVVEHYFATSVRQYWEKSYRHGKADADWWELDSVPLSARLRRCLPFDVLRLNWVETVAMCVVKAGRIRRLSHHLATRVQARGVRPRRSRGS